MLKPDAPIYYELFSKFNLKPEECYFIDDSLANIEAVETLGMAGFHFDDDVEALRDAMNELNI